MSIVYAQPQPRNALATLGAVLADFAEKRDNRAYAERLREEEERRRLEAEQRATQREASLYARNRADSLGDEQRRTADARTYEQAIYDRNRGAAVSDRTEARSYAEGQADVARNRVEFEEAKKVLLTSPFIDAATQARLATLTFDNATPMDMAMLKSGYAQHMAKANERAQMLLANEDANRERAAALAKAKEDARITGGKAISGFLAQAAQANAVLNKVAPTELDVEDELKLLAPGGNVSAVRPNDPIRDQARRNAEVRLEQRRQQAKFTLAQMDENIRAANNSASLGIPYEMPAGVQEALGGPAAGGQSEEERIRQLLGLGAAASNQPPASQGRAQPTGGSALTSVEALQLGLTPEQAAKVAARQNAVLSAAARKPMPVIADPWMVAVPSELSRMQEALGGPAVHEMPGFDVRRLR